MSPRRPDLSHRMRKMEERLAIIERQLEDGVANLEDLFDVQVYDVIDGQAPVYSTADGLWKPGFVAGGTARTSTLRKTVTQSLADDVHTKITFDTVDVDELGIADLANDELVIDTDAAYFVSGDIQYESNATGARTLVVADGIALPSEFGTNITTATGAAPDGESANLSSFTIASLSVGAEVGMRGKQASGGNLNVQQAILTVAEAVGRHI